VALARAGCEAGCSRITLAAHDGGQHAARVLVRVVSWQGHEGYQLVVAVFPNILHGYTALSFEEAHARILPRIARRCDREACGFGWLHCVNGLRVLMFRPARAIE